MAARQRYGDPVRAERKTVNTGNGNLSRKENRVYEHDPEIQMAA